MSYIDLQPDFDPPSPEEEAVDFASETGRDDGFMGGVSEEGMSCLVPRAYNGMYDELMRGAYIESYWTGFLERKLRDGEISEDTYTLYEDVGKYLSYDRDVDYYFEEKK